MRRYMVKLKPDTNKCGNAFQTPKKNSIPLANFSPNPALLSEGQFKCGFCSRILRASRSCLPCLNIGRRASYVGVIGFYWFGLDFAADRPKRA
jgi:hypothetical protein